MTRSLLCFVVAASSLWATPAHAEVLDKPADIIAAVRAGKVGAWLDDAALKKCLSADLARENAEQRINVLLQEKATLQSKSDTCAQVMTVAADEVLLLKQQGEAQGKMIESLGNDLASWYRNPAIIGVLGVAVGAVAASFVFAAAK